jgi:hypothetical protein
MAEFNLFNVPEYYTGLLGQEQTDKLKRQALGTGITNALLAFVAQPRTEGYGSALPYLGRALMAGQQSGQDVIAGGLRDFETQQRIAEMKRKQEQIAAQNQAIQEYAQKRPELASAIRANPELIKDITLQEIKPKEIEYKDVGDKLVPVYKTSGQPVQGLEPLSKNLSPDQLRQAQWEQYKFANPSASDLLSAETARQGQQITLRGQDLTNARAIESMGIQNQLKNLQAQKLQMELGQAQSSKEGAIDSYNTSLQSIDRLAKHPGLKSAVGATMQPKIPFIGEIPGTEKANFMAELDTFKSQTFLPMVQNLRGMGALSDAEGKKLTDAVGALNPSMSEKAFKESLNRIKADLMRAKNRIGKSIGQPTQDIQPATMQQAPRSREEILKQYGL